MWNSISNLSLNSLTSLKSDLCLLSLHKDLMTFHNRWHQNVLQQTLTNQWKQALRYDFNDREFQQIINNECSSLDFSAIWMITYYNRSMVCEATHPLLYGVNRVEMRVEALHQVHQRQSLALQQTEHAVVKLHIGSRPEGTLKYQHRLVKYGVIMTLAADSKDRWNIYINSWLMCCKKAISCIHVTSRLYVDSVFIVKYQ